MLNLYSKTHCQIPLTLVHASQRKMKKLLFLKSTIGEKHTLNVFSQYYLSKTAHQHTLCQLSQQCQIVSAKQASALLDFQPKRL